MGKKREWYEKFFDGLYGRVLSSQFERAKSLEQARVIKRLLGVRRGQRVLDVPCGQGRITLPLARMGLAMTGVDRTGAYVAKARMLAGRGRLKARFLQGDMRAIAFDREFDAVFNWFGSFGYFSDADNLRFCRRVLAALKPGGRFLVEGMNKSWVLVHFRPSIETRVGGVLATQRNRLRPGDKRIRSIWTLRRGRRTERHIVSMRVFTGTELRGFLRSAGFGEVRLHGPGGGRFTRHSQRLIAVASKPR
ncbi:MAG TPA: class I SAM-dependent methyltransferase [Planctomycetota bacterium]|nr:class I SAM-dependent methyltransferase [Planctomycetota bacterium]